MKERPILFSAPMVLALLAGTKTQTRRVVKPQPPANACYWKEVSDGGHWLSRDYGQSWKCPQGIAGDRLWVRETWASRGINPVVRPDGKMGAAVIEYRADNTRATWNHDPIRIDAKDYWKPLISLPRWACRLKLEVVAVRVERLNDITAADAIAEGLERDDQPFDIVKRDVYRDYLWNKKKGSSHWYSNPVESYQSLWDSINGGGSWSMNPWVWAVEFRRVT